MVVHTRTVTQLHVWFVQLKQTERESRAADVVTLRLVPSSLLADDADGLLTILVIYNLCNIRYKKLKKESQKDVQ